MPSEPSFRREMAKGPVFRKEFVSRSYLQIPIDSLTRLDHFGAPVPLGNIVSHHEVVLSCLHWLRGSSFRWANPVRQRTGSI